MITVRHYGHYKVIAELGRGGMAVVYKCWEDSLSRFVAIKVLSEHLIHNQELKQRFLREAKSMAAINHPNVIQVHFIGEENGLPFFAMEYIEGKSLADILTPNKQLSIDHAENLLYQACEGLLAAHSKNLIHRDIKPGNLMVSDNGQLKLVDFGIAQSRDFEKRLTSTGDLVGTPAYLSPEACVGEGVDFRADIYSLGIVFYEMLAGRVPFENNSPLGLLQEVSDSNILDIKLMNKKVKQKTANLLEKMVARLPKDRFQDCQEILDLLERPIGSYSIESIIKAQTLSIYKKPQSKLNNKVTMVNQKVVANTSGESKAFTLSRVKILALLLVIVLGFVIYNRMAKEEALSTNMDFVGNESATQETPKEDLQKEINNLEELEVIETTAISNGNLKKTEPPSQITTQRKGCIEVGEFVLARKQQVSSKGLKKSKILLKNLQQRAAQKISRDHNLTVYTSSQFTCPNSNESLVLTAEIQQNKLSKLFSSSSMAKGKIHITVSLTSKKSKARLAQKRFTIKNLGEKLNLKNKGKEFDFIKNFSVFIKSGINN